MQVDRMFSAEAIITIKQNRKTGDRSLSYDGGRADGERRKKYEHLKLLSMPSTILFYKNYKKKL